MATPAGIKLRQMIRKAGTPVSRMDGLAEKMRSRAWGASRNTAVAAAMTASEMPTAQRRVSRTRPSAPALWLKLSTGTMTCCSSAWAACCILTWYAWEPWAARPAMTCSASRQTWRTTGGLSFWAPMR